MKLYCDGRGSTSMTSKDGYEWGDGGGVREEQSEDKGVEVRFGGEGVVWTVLVCGEYEGEVLKMYVDADERASESIATSAEGQCTARDDDGESSRKMLPCEAGCCCKLYS